MHDLIPIRRVEIIKLIRAGELMPRFAPVERVPPKRLEFRAARPSPSRAAERERDALGDTSTGKFSLRARRHAKLRLFRVFKLFGPLKGNQGGPADYRPVAERLRLARSMRRL